MNTPVTSVVVVASCSCLPAPDWLAVLAAYVATYPEVGLFHGRCWPVLGQPPRLMESLCLALGLFAPAESEGAPCRFSRVAPWACRKSLLTSAMSAHDRADLLGSPALTDRLVQAGASSLAASDWHMRFRVPATLKSLLRTAYLDGHDTAAHGLVARDGDPTRLWRREGVGGPIAAAWRFARAKYRSWRPAKRNLLLHLPAFLLLFLAGASRHVGWQAGRRRNRFHPIA
jgi:hypothetical protein